MFFEEVGAPRSFRILTEELSNVCLDGGQNALQPRVKAQTGGCQTLLALLLSTQALRMGLIRDLRLPVILVVCVQQSRSELPGRC